MKTEAASSENVDDISVGEKTKLETKLLENKEASDDEEIEEERSWRRGYEDGE